MKKSAFIVLLILVLMFSMVPFNAALALKEPAVYKLSVRNNTGGVVPIRLVGVNSNKVFDIDSGVSEIQVPEGQYSYYAILPCGNQAGTLKIKGNDELLLSCKEGKEVKLGFCSQKALYVQVHVFDGENWIEVNPLWLPLGTPVKSPVPYIKFTVSVRCLDGHQYTKIH